RAHQLDRGHRRYSWPAMKASTSAWASSSVIYTGGCLQNHAAGASIGPARPRSLAILAQRIMPADAELAGHGVPERQPLYFHTPYCCSKAVADQYMLDYARSFGMRAAVMRMSCIYGQRQM